MSSLILFKSLAVKLSNCNQIKLPPQSMKYLILNGLSLVITSNVSLGGTTTRNKLPFRLEKTFKEVVFSQKI